MRNFERECKKLKKQTGEVHLGDVCSNDRDRTGHLPPIPLTRRVGIGAGQEIISGVEGGFCSLSRMSLTDTPKRRTGGGQGRSF